ncbi:glycoside hydrolase family 2 TIM barrel-domain containing protein [Thalassotalea fonticola]|uniref:Glycoside hydrolase family 2 TIM barrel-domain containing protein n=1 Tax=Thalassotalea fonticola TaxID=3065649 RepID=A0ABZ0GQV3_9GAMM|nr:glycoside hydrolase family 2 TIM barrel-domain containing protein [Colwelliaceae bacterium S1-1]
MRFLLKCIKWFFISITVLILLIIFSWPFWSPLMVDGKYERFAKSHVPENKENYLAQILGAQPEIACGGTAGQYNWGEQTRQYVSLNGTWQVEQGQLDEQLPLKYNHVAAVPGLLADAKPAFNGLGQPSEERDVFWYKRNFDAPETALDTALLCIAKVKYGAKVWVNDVDVGEHYGAFTQAEFNLAKAIKWGESNELVVRVGAERSQIPAFMPTGQDNEKEYWMPGIWDDVNLLFTGAQTIVRSKVETNINTGIATIKNTIKNNGNSNVTLVVVNSLREWKTDLKVSDESLVTIALAAGETKTIEQKVSVTGMKLWTLEAPFLYVADTKLKVDDVVIDDQATRFGFRSVKWKGGDERGFYLNGEKIYLRGSNFSLGRFFEDPEAGTLAWNEAWVRKLYTSYPKDYHWNLFRTSLGRMPNFWYDIADEEGFLIDDEFAYWTLMGKMKDTETHKFDQAHLEWSIVELEKEFTSWIQENWNHPSIAWWSASNETTDMKSFDTISNVRHLDSTRQWENGGWQKPHDKDDPIEDHPYIFAANFNPLLALLGGNQGAGIEALDNNPGQYKGPLNPTSIIQVTYPSDENPYIINEFGWLWLNRDGSATKLTDQIYPRLLGDDNTTDTRREAWAYLHAGLTGFWRAKRGYQGVQHFAYLSHSKPGTAYTSDNFIDLENLVMEPRWHEYSKNVWSPAAVYIDKWSDDYQRGQTADIPLIMINDNLHTMNGEVQLFVTDEAGNVLQKSERVKVSLDKNGEQAFELEIKIPKRKQFVLFAQLLYQDSQKHDVVDKRKVGFKHHGVEVATRPKM